MTAQIIDGKSIAKEILRNVRDRISLLQEHGTRPSLAAVVTGNDPVTLAEIRRKQKFCEGVGISFKVVQLPESIEQAELQSKIGELNQDQDVNGIFVQLPLPSHIKEEGVLSSVSPLKDVEGLHPMNLGRLLLGYPRFVPPVPAGIQEMLLRSGQGLEGSDTVVVGRSKIVGKPLAVLLMQKASGGDATVTICHSRTRNLAAHCMRADILIVAVGVPQFIKADMVRDGAVVIDVGLNRVRDPSLEKGYRLVGDVDFESVKVKVKAISPVPDGVGPVTLAMLLRNAVKAAELASQDQRS